MVVAGGGLYWRWTADMVHTYRQFLLMITPENQCQQYLPFFLVKFMKVYLGVNIFEYIQFFWDNSV